RGKHAQVRQELTFAWPRRESPTGDMLLRVPSGIRTLTVISGGLIDDTDVAKGWCWVKPPPFAQSKGPLILKFDQPISTPPKGTREGVWKVPMVWPEGATQLEAKVR